MHSTIIYTISYAAAGGTLLLWGLTRLLTLQARDRLSSITSKWILYTLVVQRVNGSSDVNIMRVLLFCLFVAGNVIASSFALRNSNELATRLAKLYIVNVVFLFTEGWTSLLVNKVLELLIVEYSFWYCWVGRVTVLEAVLHALLQITKRPHAVKK